MLWHVPDEREQRMIDLKAEALANLEEEEKAQRMYRPKSLTKKKNSKPRPDEPNATSASSLLAQENWDEDPPPHQTPNPTSRLIVIVEHCTAARPHRSLNGKKEHYMELCAKFEEAFHAHFKDSWDGKTEFQINPHPRSNPHAFMQTGKALRFLQHYSHLIHQRIRAGAMVVDLAEYPPQLQLYPRIGSFEVTYSLQDNGREACRARRLRRVALALLPIGPCPTCPPASAALQVLRGGIYSKLSAGKWPRVDKLVKRLEACMQSDLWSQHVQQLAEADAATRTAEAHREAAAGAAERAQLEEEQVLVAQRQLEALRVEVAAAAESGSDAAATEDARARLAVFEQRLTKEAAEAAEATHTAQELAVTAEATWSVAQTKAALHTAKREGDSAAVKAAEDNLEAAQAALVAETKEVRAAALNLQLRAVDMNSASTQ